jgi:DNA-binding NarL/FixJ family response regulator
MQPLSIVIANRDSHSASQLAASLNTYFRNVSVVRSLDEVRNAIPKHRAQLAILDLELASVEDVERLAHEFNHTSIVCTHRIPDDEMWASALAAGAIDCCPSDDAAGIVNAVDRYVRVARGNAA